MDAGLNPRMLRKHLSTFRGRWDTSEEIKFRFLRVKQVLRLHVSFPAAPWTLDKTAVLRCLPHTRPDCPFCLSLSSLSLAGKHAWLSFPPSLPPSLLLSSPTPTHIAATRLSFGVSWQIRRGYSTNMLTEAAFYFLSTLFPFVSDLNTSRLRACCIYVSSSSISVSH